MSEEAVERAVTGMKELYVRLRGLTARRVGHAPQHEAKWYGLADELLTRGLNPFRYVRWAYDFFRQSNPDVYVNQITSPKMLRIFVKDHPNYEAEAQLAIRLQADTLKTQLGLGRSPRELIEDSVLELGPVFKYILALQYDLPVYADQLRGAAELEMACEPLYAQIVGGLLRSAERASAVTPSDGSS